MVLNFLNSLIPKSPSIEGFAPLPSQGANEFMTMQGSQMALGFGAYYSIGKRMVSKLDNEDFNAMLAKPELFQQYLLPHFNSIVDAFEKRMDSPHYMMIQNKIIDAGIVLEKQKLEENIKLIQWFLQRLAETGLQGLDALATALGIPKETLQGWFDSDTNITINDTPIGDQQYVPEYQGATSASGTSPSDTTTTTEPEPVIEPEPVDYHRMVFEYQSYRVRATSYNYTVELGALIKYDTNSSQEYFKGQIATLDSWVQSHASWFDLVQPGSSTNMKNKAQAKTLLNKLSGMRREYYNIYKVWV